MTTLIATAPRPETSSQCSPVDQRESRRARPIGHVRCRGSVTPSPPTHRRDTRRSLVYLNNRYHDPTLGVFISVDPLVIMTGEPYVYGAANPVTYSDPSGLVPCHLELAGCTGGRGNEGGKNPGELPCEPTCGEPTLPIEPSEWCGAPPCPTTIGPDHVFASDAQATAFLTYTAPIYGFADAAVNSESLWAHYTTASGKQAVRWQPGVGWVRRVAGLTAGGGVSVGRTLEVGGRALIVLGAALEGAEQWQRDDGYDSGVRLFRSVAAGGTKAGFTYGGASAAAGGAGAFCASGATISCGGPWGTAAVVGIAGVLGGFFGNKAADVVIERAF